MLNRNCSLLQDRNAAWIIYASETSPPLMQDRHIVYLYKNF